MDVHLLYALPNSTEPGSSLSTPQQTEQGLWTEGRPKNKGTILKPGGGGSYVKVYILNVKHSALFSIQLPEI